MTLWNMAVKTVLRRSFSEHVKDSTHKALDVFWRSVRERRLWGESGGDETGKVDISLGIFWKMVEKLLNNQM